MSGKLDQSLDQIVKTNRSSARNTRRGRPAAKGAKAAAAPAGGIKKHGKASRPSGKVVVPTAPAVKVSGDRVEKIVVSNLPFDVTEDQIQTYLSQTLGPVSKATMVNPGSAFITFRRPGVSAQEAAKINELFVDKRKLKVELVSTIPKEHVKPLGERIVSKSNASAPKSAAAAKPATTNNTATRGGRGARGRGRGRRGRDSTARAKPKTAEELDAEMADYFETGVTGAEGAPAATNGAAQPAVTNGGDTGMDDEIL